MPMVNAPEMNGYSYLDRRFNHSLFLAWAAETGRDAGCRRGKSERDRRATGERVSADE